MPKLDITDIMRSNDSNFMAAEAAEFIVVIWFCYNYAFSRCHAWIMITWETASSACRRIQNCKTWSHYLWTKCELKVSFTFKIQNTDLEAAIISKLICSSVIKLWRVIHQYITAMHNCILLLVRSWSLIYAKTWLLTVQLWIQVFYAGS